MRNIMARKYGTSRLPEAGQAGHLGLGKAKRVECFAIPSIDKRSRHRLRHALIVDRRHLVLWQRASRSDRLTREDPRAVPQRTIMV
jgi:hypothetical protein